VKLIRLDESDQIAAITKLDEEDEIIAETDDLTENQVPS
jgi:hypothetical protein